MNRKNPDLNELSEADIKRIAEYANPRIVVLVFLAGVIVGVVCGAYVAMS